ncbi:C40 family peptidase [Haloechinothrix halophila]|uniref:C40 family peptidase n=1 Tax=Haloechinothrix halophila TaxID=1069073 RepID=UPI0003F6F1C9|nr:C40 family peptidase [Haloechinothrix halophila]
MGTAGGVKTALIAGIALAVYLVLVMPALLLGTVFMATQGSAIGVTAAAEANCGFQHPLADFGPGGSTQHIGNQQWTGEQLTNAQTIVTIAVRRTLPKRAAVIAVSAAMVESQLRNLSYGDRDSLGLFQQRPSQGWGSREEILHPPYAANTFYDHLIALPGWHTMPPGVAAQAVQRSGFPDRYAPQEPVAAEIVARYWQGPDNPVPPAPPGQTSPMQQVNLTHGGCPDQGGSDLPLDPQKLPNDFQLPIDPAQSAAVSYALAQLGKPYVWGATGPDAFDCSGLMQAAWANAGVGISRTTTTQRHDGVAVGSLNQIQPGDLLFIPGSLGSPTNPRHVGMYAGHGVVVNAYDSSTGVILETFDAWAPNVVAIRRIAVGGDHAPSR